MSRGIELELSVLKAIADEGRTPNALRLAMCDCPWLVEEAGVHLYHRPNYPLFVLGTAFLIAVFSQPAQAAAQRSYRVKWGDSLWSIAQKELGSGMRWKELYRLNRQRIMLPNVIFPYQTILLPGKAPVATATKKKLAATHSILPTPHPTPLVPKPVKTATPKPTPRPTPMVTASPKPVPRATATPAPVFVPQPTSTPAAMDSPAALPTPVASAPPVVTAKVGYWGASNETGNLLSLNSGMLTAQVEVTPWGPAHGFGLSGNAQTSPFNFSSTIWDAYYRSGILKVGYRSDDLLRRTIPYGNLTKQDLHSESLIAGFVFGVPLGDALALNFDLLGGATFHNVAVGTTERVLTDLSAELAYHLNPQTDINLGYRSYVFGTFSDIRNTYTMQTARSAAFGSYQGPTLGVSYRF